MHRLASIRTAYECPHTLIQVSVVYFPGCPGAKKTEFLTSVLDALSTDMVHAVTDPASAGRYDIQKCHYWRIMKWWRGYDQRLNWYLSFRMAEPDPNHTLEERVVHWYFSQLDKNSSGDIGKKEIKPFKRFLRKKSKPKKCVKKFVEYCDISNDKALSLQELMGCLGVTKEEGELSSTAGSKCVVLRQISLQTILLTDKI